MSDFRFDGQALPEIEASGMAPIFNAGRHDVTITESKVNVHSNTDVQIELKYANDNGQIRQWITWVSETEEHQKWGRERFAKILHSLGMDSTVTPPIETIRGIPLTINVVNKVSKKDGKARDEVNYTIPIKSTTLKASDSQAPAAGKPLDDEIPF
jgi:hypothetical protein